MLDGHRALAVRAGQPFAIAAGTDAQQTKQYYVNEAKYQARRAAERAEKNVKWLQKAAAKE